MWLLSLPRKNIWQRAGINIEINGHPPGSHWHQFLHTELRGTKNILLLDENPALNQQILFASAVLSIRVANSKTLREPEK